jgi:hypothetical protein
VKGGMKREKRKIGIYSEMRGAGEVKKAGGLKNYGEKVMME